jgi:hypothetical protein
MDYFVKKFLGLSKILNVLVSDIKESPKKIKRKYPSVQIVM